ncbi:glycosyltransferase [Nocardioides xinjiangensis]|uniref:glycosyltransferase n=1 Tax=Nocardioides xinjiangensis TaxID=2817376 RepID=UPI001B315F37|nr:glycosyltransferase [Nocardioides sp. SYSU D00778]
MARILFVTWDGGGNVPPALLLARELVARGHAVRVLGHAEQRRPVEKAGLEFVPPRRTRPFDALEQHSTLDIVAAFTDRGIGRDLLAELDTEPADLVVVDCLLFGALDAARRSGVPYVVLEHLYDGYYRRECLRGPLGLATRTLGLRPRAALDGAALRLVGTAPELDPVPGTPEPNLRQVGPLIPVPEQSASTPDEQCVLVSLSTFAFPAAPRVLSAVLTALEQVPAHVVCTTGPALSPSEVPPRAGLRIHQYLPHAQVLPHVSLVVGHGGHGTTMQALAHGIPLLVIPLDPQTDQPSVGRSIRTAGAGATLDRDAGPEEISQMIKWLLIDPAIRAAAGDLGEALRRSRGLASAADEIDRVLTAAT